MVVRSHRHILFFYWLSVLIALFRIQFTHAQGAGGGGGGGSGGGGSWSGGGGGSSGGGGSWSGGDNSWISSGGDGSGCDTEACRRGWMIAGSVIGGLFGLICLGACCVAFGPACYSYVVDICKSMTRKCRSICNGKYNKKISNELDNNDIALDPIRRKTTLPSISHTIVPLTSHTQLPPILNSSTSITDIFQSGTYNMRYYQYYKWHGPSLVQLEFKDGYVHGNGYDDVGSYNVTGTYSTIDNHLCIYKQYKRGTGDRYENFGHQVTIDLKWNDNAQHFDGKWIVKTANYSGQDKFELKFRQHITTV